jgi:hypothetical protein
MEEGVVEGVVVGVEEGVVMGVEEGVEEGVVVGVEGVEEGVVSPAVTRRSLLNRSLGVSGRRCTQRSSPRCRADTPRRRRSKTA